jgi:hypothetical protein
MDRVPGYHIESRVAKFTEDTGVFGRAIGTDPDRDPHWN